ncbi:MAG: hypothetical protein ACOC56_03340 [Atribacterota bacterium]
MPSELMILLIPFFIGYFLVFLKIEAVNNFTEKFDEWLKNKKKNISEKKSKIPKFTLLPMYSLLTVVNDLTKNIKNTGIKSGIRIASYLWIIGFFILVFIIAGYVLLLIALIIIGLWLLFWILGHILGGTDTEESEKVYVEKINQSPSFVESIYSFLPSKTTKEKTASLFNVKEIDINEDGKLYTEDNSQFPARTEIGYIDEKGNIYDTRKMIKDKVGSIDKKGNIYNEKDMMKEKL